MSSFLKYSFYFFCLFVLVSCGTSIDEKLPKDIIQPNQMEGILYDINFAEIRLQRREMSQPTQDAQRKDDLTFILKKHQVSDTLFRKSYDFYSTNPVWLKKVLEGMIIKVENESQALEHEDSLSKR